MEFDISSLIREIKARKPLWQKDNYDHNCREVINKLWLEVADAVGVSKEIVKSKWKGLRDNFRSELRKIPMKPHKYRSKWVYFSDMMFLKDQLSTRSPGSYMSGDAEDVSVDVDVYTMGDDGDDDKIDYGPLSNNDGELLSTSTVYQPVINPYDGIHSLSGLGTHIREGSILEDLLNTGKEECYEQSSESSDLWDKLPAKKRKVGVSSVGDIRSADDDYLFLMSLLPTIKTLSPAKKMLLRLKIQELVYNEVYSPKNVTPSQTPAPSSP